MFCQPPKFFSQIFLLISELPQQRSTFFSSSSSILSLPLSLCYTFSCASIPFFLRSYSRKNLGTFFLSLPLPTDATAWVCTCNPKYFNRHLSGLFTHRGLWACHTAYLSRGLCGTFISSWVAHHSCISPVGLCGLELCRLWVT